MRRETIKARTDWTTKVEEVGFTYHTGGLPPEEAGFEGSYWDETTCYAFSLDEVIRIETATEVLHGLCLKAVDHVCRNPDLMERFAIPEEFRPYVVRSWQRYDPHVMGRFDLAFDASQPGAQPKLLEYNADTPTLVIETAVVQWFWLQDVHPDKDQFNSLHERLIARYGEIGGLMPKGATLHFSSLPAEDQEDGFSWSIEEAQHTSYFRDLAEQAGLSTKFTPIQTIGWDSATKRLVDQDDAPIAFWSKLYPWEWLTQEAFASHLLADRMGVIEPVWKMLLSNKAILPVLWELFPDHPNLLPAYWSPERLGESYIAKPILAREGANIELRDGDVITRTQGSYGENPVVYQGLANLGRFGPHGRHRTVIGSWVVGDSPAGMILREADSPIVVNTSKIVPHYIDG